MPRHRKLDMLDYAVIGGLLAFAFIPDPTDIVDAMLPIVEPLLAYIYYRYRTSGRIL